MLIMPSFKKSLIVKQFQGNYLNIFVHMQFKLEIVQFTYSRKQISKILNKVRRCAFTCD